MGKYSNLAVKNASVAAEKAMENGFDAALFDKVYEETLAQEPEENFKTGAVYDSVSAA